MKLITRCESRCLGGRGLRVVVAGTALLAASFAMAATPSPKSGPSAPGSSDNSDATAPVIDGITISRKDGSFLGLTVDGTSFKLRFYDKDKKPVAPDVARAAARWSPVNEKAQYRVILNPVGDALVSPAQVRPPLTFRVFFTLFAADGSAVENFTVQLDDSVRATAK